MKIVNPIGKRGEDIACAYLVKKGYKIIERNFRKKYAEIDIICTKDETLVFVEVKTRTSQRFGTPFEAITYRKLKPLIQLAQFYSLAHPKLPQSLRIDAISVQLNGKNDVTNIEHLENITV